MERGTAVERWAEPAKFVPVVFIILNMVGLYWIYMNYHLLPLMQESEGGSQSSPRTTANMVFFHAVTVMMVVCYVRSILQHPGVVPSREADPTWAYPTDGEAPIHEPVGPHLVETKRSGDRRHCKWCAKYKPDRCHHCRVCRTCVLRMDHHCPWIYNCVGFRNHKFFFLLLFYSVINCHLITWTMLGTVRESVDVDVHFMHMFVLLFGETLAAFLGVLVSVFFGFHIWLMLKAMTTIEFCETSAKRTGYDMSIYDRGSYYGNLCAVLGDQPLLWLLPVSPPSGDGMRFHQTEDVRLMHDIETSQGVRRKAAGASFQQKPRRNMFNTAGTGSAPASGLTSGAQSEDESIPGQFTDYGSSKMLY